MPKVSVIVPIYNVEQYIERCAHSLFSQTLNSIEYIFVDDCSPDKSIDILRDVIRLYPHRKGQVRIIRHSVNKGLTCARNSGLAVASGEFIAHCDSDDYVDVHMYQLLYEEAKYRHADVVLCDIYLKSSNSLEIFQTITISDKTNTVKSYMAGGYTTVWNKLVKRQLYDTFNLRSQENITYCEDFHLSVRQLFYASTIAKVDRPLYYYNQQNVNSIVHTFGERALIEERIVYEEIIEFLIQENSFAPYQKEMSWRILKNKQDLVLSKHTHSDFMQLYPWSHPYIMSCPTYFCNTKIKIMMWLLTHHCRFILLPILGLRKFMNR